MSSNRFKALSMVLGLAAIGSAAIPDQVHPDFTLGEVPLPENYRTMGMTPLPDGRMAIAVVDFMGGGEMPSARSDKHKILLVTGMDKTAAADVEVEEIANTWWQPAGIVVANNKLYVSDRDGFYEINQLSRPADLKANRKLIVKWPDENKWNSGTQWHQWVFTPMFKQGFFYAPYSGSIRPGGPSDVNPTSSFTGAFLKWDLAGNLTKFAGGLRSPNGANLDEATGEMFVADNEGSWLPSSTFMLMKEGRFYGHRNISAKGTTANWAENLPYEPPVAWLPYKGQIGKSPGQPIVLEAGNYAGDWLITDINNYGLLRVALDRVGATPNGAAFWFSKGMSTAATNRITYGADGSLYVGTFCLVGGNWPSTTRNTPIYRMKPKAGLNAFEMKAVKSLKDGLELVFTKPVNPATVTRDIFTATQKAFERIELYGAKNDTIKEVAMQILETAVSSDGRRVYLKIPGMIAGRMMYVKHTTALKAADGSSPWNNEVWFTQNHISTRAWDATVGVREMVRANAALEGLLTQRVSAPGVLSVDVSGEGPWKARLVSPDGSVVAARDGAGAARFDLARGARSGLHFLRVSLKGGEVVRKVVF